jgi:purine-binding chemotaxis protein CheW
MSSGQQLCTFFVDGLFLGVEVEKVQEVIRFQEMTCVPLAPGVIGGLINLRGQIVTAVDLRKRLALRPRSAEELPINVVVQTNDGAMSLLVDDIGDVVEVHTESFERAPHTLTGVTRELIHGVYKLENQLLLLLDTDKAVNLAAEAAHTA